MPNVYCEVCGLRSDSHEGVYREGPLVCPVDGATMHADPSELPPPPPGFVQHDHEFTPEQAKQIIDLVPADAHHWRDIPRKAPQAVAKYTELMATGRWRDETLAAGFYEHPIRWDERGRLTHGIMRLIACRDSGRTFTAAVLRPIGLLPEVFDGHVEPCPASPSPAATGLAGPRQGGSV